VPALLRRDYHEHGPVDPYEHNAACASSRTELFVVDGADRLQTTGESRAGQPCASPPLEAVVTGLVEAVSVVATST